MLSLFSYFARLLSNLAGPNLPSSPLFVSTSHSQLNVFPISLLLASCCHRESIIIKYQSNTNSAARRLENNTLRERKQDPGGTTIGETAIDKFDSNRYCSHEKKKRYYKKFFTTSDSWHLTQLRGRVRGHSAANNSTRHMARVHSRSCMASNRSNSFLKL